MTNRNCRLCGFSSTRNCLELKRVPRNLQRLLKKEELNLDRAVRLDVLQCSACGFVQFSPILGEDYDDAYLSTVSHSPQMQHLRNADALVNGIEPYVKVGGLVVEKGFTIESQCVTAVRDLPDVPFDGFVTRLGHSFKSLH